MLISFTVENYRSFKGPVTLSMEATHLVGRDPELDASAIFDVPGHHLLAMAAVFGPNASGKSNLVRAILAFQALVARPVEDQDSPLPVDPFRLDAATATEPTRMEVRLLIHGRETRYGFRATQDKVHEEWLYERPKRREVLLFRRDGTNIELGASFTEGAGLERRTRTNALFLNVVAAFNGEKAGAVRLSIGKLMVLVDHHDPGRVTATLKNLSSWFAGSGPSDEQRFMRSLLRDADTGIEDFEVEEGPPDLQSLASHTGGRVRTVHPIRGGSPGATTRFDLEQEESAGTQRLFLLAGAIRLVLVTGSILVVDELDARLHPNLTRKVIDLFRSPTSNPNRAQLVFTTHDTNLLTPDLFRRDQIWFVEKGSEGDAELYSLAEIKGVREDAAWEKAYLSGRFGAVPLLNRFGEGLNVRAEE